MSAGRSLDGQAPDSYLQCSPWNLASRKEQAGGAIDSYSGRPKSAWPQNRNGGFQRVAPGASFEASIREAGQPGFGSISPMAPDLPWGLSGFSFGPYLLPGFGGNYQSGSPTEMVMLDGF